MVVRCPPFGADVHAEADSARHYEHDLPSPVENAYTIRGRLRRGVAAGERVCASGNGDGVLETHISSKLNIVNLHVSNGNTKSAVAGETGSRRVPVCHCRIGWRSSEHRATQEMH
jgi:hypothetical protein